MERQRDDFPSKPPQSHHLQWIWTWLVVSTILKNISQWEGLSHILWKIKNVWNHQPGTVRSSVTFLCDLFGGQNPRPSGPARFWSLHQRKPGFWVQICWTYVDPPPEQWNPRNWSKPDLNKSMAMSSTWGVTWWNSHGFPRFWTSVSRAQSSPFLRLRLCKGGRCMDKWDIPI